MFALPFGGDGEGEIGCERLVAPGVVTGLIPTDPAEHHDREFGFEHQFETGRPANEVGCLLREFQRLLDRYAVGIGAVGSK